MLDPQEAGRRELGGFRDLISGKLLAPWTGLVFTPSPCPHAHILCICDPQRGHLCEPIRCPRAAVLRSRELWTPRASVLRSHLVLPTGKDTCGGGFVP